MEKEELKEVVAEIVKDVVTGIVDPINKKVTNIEQAIIGDIKKPEKSSIFGRLNSLELKWKILIWVAGLLASSGAIASLFT